MERNCKRVRRLLWDLVDGGLTLGQEQAVRRHLEACSPCRHEWQNCLQAERALASAPAHIPPPGDLRADFYARLAAERAPSRFGELPLAFRRVVLPALVAGLLGFVLLRAHFVSAVAPTSGTVVRIETQAPDRSNRALTQPQSLGPEWAASQSFLSTSEHLTASATEPVIRHPVRHYRHGRASIGLLAHRVAPARRRTYLARDLQDLHSRSRIAAPHTYSPAGAADLARLQRPATAPAAPMETGADEALTPEVAAATLAEASGEQEVHVTDEERGFTRSARIIAASAINTASSRLSHAADDTDTPVVSIEAGAASEGSQ
jgi:hypothetical protein